MLGGPSVTAGPVHRLATVLVALVASAGMLAGLVGVVISGSPAAANGEPPFTGPRLAVNRGMRRVVEPSPIALAASAPGPSPSPSTTPFPYPTVPPSSAVATGPRFEPRGHPDASVTRHGVRVELWRSADTVAPGEWVQFAVRTTNVGKDAAWQHSGECLTSGTEVTAELRDTIPKGVAQTGNAAELKRRLTRSTGAWVPAWRYRSELDAVSVRAWAECGILPGPLKLRPGESRLEHFAWYVGDRFSPEATIWQPARPGTVPVTVTWPYLGRGERPHVGRLEGPADTISVSVPLTITGDGPDTPSMDELVDAALADPEWRAWVDADPTRERWGMLDATIWAGPDYPEWPTSATLDHPDGILEIELDQSQPDRSSQDRGSVLLDPWTGEVLDVLLPSGWEPPASPAPS